MALSIEIKPAKEFAASLEYAADALDRVADRESKVNAITKQVGNAAKFAANEYKKLVSYGERANKANVKNTDAVEKQNKVEKKNREEKGKGLSSLVKYAAAFSAATFAAGALAYKIASIGKEAYDSERSSSALVKAFTMGRDGTKVLNMLDIAAGQLGQTIDETRRKFVDYRAAGFTTKDSGALIKTRADLIAVGLTAKEADAELSRVVGAADRMGNVVSHRLLKEIQKAYGGIGSGAIAAERALWSVESAQNKVSDAFTRVKSDFWASIEKDVGRAVHRLADFTTELFKSEQGKAFINDLSGAFRDFASLVTAENLTTGLNAIRATLEAIATTAKMVKMAFGGGFGEAAAQLDNAVNSFDRNDTALAARAKELGIDISKGLAAGIASKKQELQKSGQFMGDWVTKATASDLEIQSPSKVFARMGRDTVRGFVQGEERELSATTMPLEARPVEMPQLNVNPLQETTNNNRGTTAITINVSGGGGNAQDIAMAIRREFQTLMENGQLSWGSV